ncbi:unnamed protein product [Rotaria sp. Silwood1]|nr:unnamed protein product [Rotaria sp. Silwood1]CAF3442570.1 unnamed protein product [Rotaria sp. Silwood1]CAF4779372.1 unnamed protein product [Rotaria sp. Silwood1]
MDIKRSCLLSSLIDNTKPIMSTPRNRPPQMFSSESNTDNIYALNLTPLVNASEKSGLLDEQFRLEHDIDHQSSMKTQDSFRTTYSSLQTILSQMQLKLASVFLEETEYLKQREQQVEQEEQSLTKRMQQLKNIQIERKQIEQEFSKLKDRLETAVIEVTNFQTNGIQILRTLFSESRQIDEELSGLISQCIASLCRSRTIVNSKINNFLQKSEYIQSEFIDRQVLIHDTQSSIQLMLELVNTLNQLNTEHSQDIIIATTDFEKRYQEFTDLSQTTKYHLNVDKEMNEIRLLENKKIQLEKELLEQTILLENITTIIGKSIIN